MKKPDLLSCPFCGRKADYRDNGIFGYVYCKECLVKLDGIRLIREPNWRVILAEEWNTRSYPKEILELIERNQPKKPIQTHSVYADCPVCVGRKDVVVSKEMKYCYECGQRLDWSI